MAARAALDKCDLAATLELLFDCKDSLSIEEAEGEEEPKRRL